MKQANSNQKTQ